MYAALMEKVILPDLYVVGQEVSWRASRSIVEVKSHLLDWIPLDYDHFFKQRG